MPLDHSEHLVLDGTSYASASRTVSSGDRFSSSGGLSLIRTIVSESGEWPRLQERLSGKKRSRRRGSIDLADGRVTATVLPLPEGRSAPRPRLPYPRALPIQH